MITDVLPPFYGSQYIALFRNQSASKATGVENRCQISHFLTPYKN